MDPILNNRYQLEKPLGRGGMAAVFQARDLMLERTIAVKILLENFSRSPAFQERFRQEAKAAANLSHPNIVTIHDFGLDKERLFIVMEYVPGQDLKKIIADNPGGLPLEKATRLFVQACAGVGYAHRAGLVHCDIKPHNMLITPDNRLKVTDFGIARALASVSQDEQTDSVWGSPSYFSPEQAAGNAPSPASDVYGLGVVLYEMFTGQLPFTAETPIELARMHRFSAPPSPRELNPALSPTLEKIILKVLSKEPAARYRTADQLGRILINFAQPEKSAEMTKQFNVSAPLPQATPTPEAVKKDIEWSTVVLGLLALAAVGGLIPFWLWVYYSLNP
ncbi:MAG: Serine/threonine-protein kinase PrkC [Chloroflexi bacterium]|nr:Serine/threonine-protein kinase PrkC [Chloroflexota bacterium]